MIEAISQNRRLITGVVVVAAVIYNRQQVMKTMGNVVSLVVSLSQTIVKNQKQIAIGVSAALLVYKWSSIKPIVVSVIGLKGAALVALVAFVGIAVLTGIGVRNWLMNEPQKHLREKRKPKLPQNPAAAQQAKAAIVAERAKAAFPLLEKLRDKIKNHPCNATEKAVLTPMSDELDSCCTAVNALDAKPKDTFRSNSVFASSVNLFHVSLEEALQPSYDLVMNPASHQKIASNPFSEEIKRDMKAIVAAAGLIEKETEEFSADTSTTKIKLVEA